MSESYTPHITMLSGYIQGYGAPGEHWVVGVFDNRTLFRCASWSEADAAICGERERVKWEREWNPKEAFFDAIRGKPLYSPLCSHCGDPGGNSSCLGRTWCSKPECRAALEAAIADHTKAEAQRQFDFELRRTREREERVRQCNTAIHGAFHWRDGWYFIRLGNGAVRIIWRPTPQSECFDVDMTIPPDEWASIVCVVSWGGETEGRWQAARRFHNVADPAREEQTDG